LENESDYGTMTRTEDSERSSSRLRVIYSTILLAAHIIGLVGYKGYSGFSKLQQVRASGTLEIRDDLFRTGQGSTKFRFLVLSVKYLQIVWPALLFGVLTAAGVRAFVSPTRLARVLGEGAVRAQIAAAMAGTPLMLCSCCASPLFSATYERSRRLSPSLALMLAAPGMNPASVALCFMLFPTRVVAARVIMTLAAVFFASRLPDLLVLGTSPPNNSLADALAVRSEAFGSRGLLSTYLRSCGHVAIRTIPLIVLGTMVAMLIPNLPRAQTFASMGGGTVIIALAALLAVPVALPSFFEIPLAFSILAAGAPLGAVAAVIFAGPIVNLPSLLVVGRHAGWKVSASLASSVWAIAFVGGLALN
jgi:uncharacterized protein